MSTSAFSTGDDVMSQKLDCHATATVKEDLHVVYEIDRCVTWIQSFGYKRIALQFPDSLLVDAPMVADEIKLQVPVAKVFILADTSYSSCCVDEVAAEHYSADCIIHYGRACLSPSARLSVLYVFGRNPIDIDDCVHNARQALGAEAKIVLIYDTTYSYAAENIFAKLKEHFQHIIFSRLSDPSNDVVDPVSSCGDSCQQGSQTSPDFNSDSHQQLENYASSSPSSSQVNFPSFCKCGRVINLPSPEASIDDYTFLFIGTSDSPALLNFMMTFSKCPFHTYNPILRQCERESMNVNKALMKRYYLIERAKDANIVGIVVGTLGVVQYRDMIDHLKQLLKTAGKKSYTFVIGRLNPAKLANFAEVDIHVLVACPESSLVEQSQFYRPVVNPLEMEMACNKARSWTGDYSTDFRELLPGASNYIQAPAFEESETADVSLINNKIRTMGTRECPELGTESQQVVALRSDSTVVANVAESAGEFLAGRSWQGLERKLGETPVAKASEGQHGIAASYQHEPVS